MGDGVLIALIGTLTSLWGFLLSHNPNQLRKGPRWLQAIQTYSLLYGLGSVKSREKLTDQQIRNYARRQILISSIVIVCGIVIILVDMFG